jgi:hypothetical protein
MAATVGMAVVSGCSSAPSVPSSHQTDTGTPTQQLAAQILNLKTADFPRSWKTVPSSGGKNYVRLALSSCVAQQSHAPSPIATGISANFLEGKSGKEVGSQVQIYGSTKEAARAAELSNSSAVSSCLQSTLQESLPPSLPSTEKVTNITVSVIPASKGLPQSFGQRVTVTISYQGTDEKSQTSDVYVDVLGFAHGQALIAAELENPGSPPASSLESSTMATLLKRAQTG